MIRRTRLNKLQILMKTIPVSLIVAALLAPLVVSAQPEGSGSESTPRSEESKSGGRGAFLKTWKAADQNDDGSLSETEFSELPRIHSLPEEKRGRLFKRLDKNTDGKLDRAELRQMGRPHDGQGPPMQRLWELDADQSGGVSFDEFKTGRVHAKLEPEKQQMLFRRLDSNGDGVITPADKPEPPFKRDGEKPQPRRDGERLQLKRGLGGQSEKPRIEPRQMIHQFDQNKDGALSFEEFRASPAVNDLTEDEQEDRFEAIDKDHDLKISSKDFPPPPPRDDAKRPEAPSAPAPMKNP